MTNEKRDEMLTEIHTAVSIMSTKVKSHEEDLYGNGKAGIKMDVDRLKRFNKGECWLGGMVLVTVLGILAKFIHFHVTK